MRVSGHQSVSPPISHPLPQDHASSPHPSCRTCRRQQARSLWSTEDAKQAGQHPDGRHRAASWPGPNFQVRREGAATRPTRRGQQRGSLPFPCAPSSPASSICCQLLLTGSWSPRLSDIDGECFIKHPIEDALWCRVSLLRFCLSTSGRPCLTPVLSSDSRKAQQILFGLQSAAKHGLGEKNAEQHGLSQLQMGFTWSFRSESRTRKPDDQRAKLRDLVRYCTYRPLSTREDRCCKRWVAARPAGSFAKQLFRHRRSLVVKGPRLSDIDGKCFIKHLTDTEGMAVRGPVTSMGKS